MMHLPKSIAFVRLVAIVNRIHHANINYMGKPIVTTNFTIYADDTANSLARDNSRLFTIYDTFSNTVHGKQLNKSLRYEKYKPSNITKKRWEQLLGPDVNNLKHMLVTYGLAHEFVLNLQKNQPGLVTEEDGVILEVAALIHDWAEAIVGDISFGDKTVEAEEKEQADFEAHLHEFYKGDATNLIDRARKDVIFNHGKEADHLGKIFNAIERIGYMQTALRSYSHIIKRDASDCEAGLTWLQGDVLLNQIPSLLEYAKEYIPIKQYLADRQKDISSSFILINKQIDVFAKYGEQREAKIAQFEHANNLWVTSEK
jgi:hypothetical protein